MTAGTPEDAAAADEEGSRCDGGCKGMVFGLEGRGLLLLWSEGGK